MEIKETERGFSYSEFSDSYGAKCSIQKSSSAMDDYIWFGIDKPEITIFENENMGKYIKTAMPKTFMVNARMHLNREQVKELLPILEHFVNTGELP